MELLFPKGFLWGTSTAGHQIEGDNRNSDWWAYEHQGKIHDGSVSGLAVDYWNRYEEDHILMEKLGYQAFRLGIEWARIEPSEGVFDKTAIERYHNILKSLKRHGIKICLTIYHWVLPLWVSERGGWENPRILKWFERYAKVIVNEFGEYPYIWVTINEPVVMAMMGYLQGIFPPEKKSIRLYLKILKRLQKAHARLYSLIHKSNVVSKQAGIAMAYQDMVTWGSPGFKGLYEKLVLPIFKAVSFNLWDYGVSHGMSIPGLKGSYDFSGVNYYFKIPLKFDISHTENFSIDIAAVQPGADKTIMGWQIAPEGFYRTLMTNWKKFRKPIYVTENGIADPDDQKRPGYILEHLAEMHHAIQDGAEILGYFYWSFIDNFEWREGYSCPFGLIACDGRAPLLKRNIRKSAYLYADIIKANGITEDIVNRYAPELKEKIFQL